MGARSTAIKTTAVMVALAALVAVAIQVAGTDSLASQGDIIKYFQHHAAIAIEFSMRAVDTFTAWLTDHYQRVPTLVLGLAALVVFPIVALASAIVRHVSGSFADDAQTQPTATSTSRRSRKAQPRWPSKALVVLRDPTGFNRGKRFALAQPVVQIGRSQDVDIVIPDPTVHRHHATIHCTEDAEYLVTDLSAGTGNGVLVNGQPVLQHQIFNGDEIRLGRARLMFMTSEA